MHEGRRVLALVPARGRNDGVDHMNMRELGGHPLIHYTLLAASACPSVDRILVSTESHEIAEYARAHGAEVPFMRPVALAGTDVLMEAIVEHVLEGLASAGEAYDVIVNLYPTAPFKTPALIRRTLDALTSGPFDFVVPLFAHRDYFWEVGETGDAHLIADGERTTRARAAKKFEERGGVYAYDIARGNWRDTPERRVGHVELGYHESRMVTSVYELVMYERLVGFPSGLIEEILAAD